MKHVNLMAKPTGSVCNLDCDYCFYLEKWRLYGEEHQPKMDDAVLERYIEQMVACHPEDTTQYTFAWQGGEPLLMGVPFFRRAVELQGQYTKGKPFVNTLQTNGTLLNDEWCRFFAANSFFVGISVDGTQQQHDAYRKTRGGQGTYLQVERGLRLLQQHGVEYNILTVVHDYNVQNPRLLYKHLKGLGATHIQFTPLVERLAQDDAPLGLKLSHPQYDGNTEIAPWSVSPLGYANFLKEVFKEWSRRDMGLVFVNMFETTLRLVMGERSNSCVFDTTCGDALIIEHNGDVYSCDHFVFPQHNLGNIMTNSLETLVESDEQAEFGKSKRRNMATECTSCEYLHLCNGGCPKHRFETSADGTTNKNYLCDGYKNYFAFVVPHLKTIQDALNNGTSGEELQQHFRKKFR